MTRSHHTSRVVSDPDEGGMAPLIGQFPLSLIFQNQSISKLAVFRPFEPPVIGWVLSV